MSCGTNATVSELMIDCDVALGYILCGYARIDNIAWVDGDGALHYLQYGCVLIDDITWIGGNVGLCYVTAL